MVRASFPANPSRASRVGQVIHTDLAGPMRIPCIFSGHRYMIIFVDDYSRLLRVYTIKRKSDALSMFKKYILDIQAKPETVVIDLSNPVSQTILLYYRDIEHCALTMEENSHRTSSRSFAIRMAFRRSFQPLTLLNSTPGQSVHGARFIKWLGLC